LQKLCHTLSTTWQYWYYLSQGKPYSSDLLPISELVIAKAVVFPHLWYFNQKYLAREACWRGVKCLSVLSWRIESCRRVITKKVGRAPLAERAEAVLEFGERKVSPKC
jgi:hypothetical protein